MRIRIVAMMATALLACIGAARAEWPDRPLRLVVPVAPGGPTDIIARLLAQHLSPRLGQSVVVENRPGAGGNIGTQAVVQAEADGYTMLMASVSNAVNPSLFAQLPYDTDRDLMAVSQVSRVPILLLVPARMEDVRTVADLVARARREPLVYATGGVGTSGHLVAEMFAMTADVRLTPAHYRGSALADQDLEAARVQLKFDNAPTSLPMIAAGRTRAIAVTTGTRLPELPDVPTMKEAMPPGFEVSSWHGIMLRSGTPRPIVEKLAREVAAATRAPEAAARWQAIGVQPVGSDPDAFTAFFREERARWAEVIRAANVRPE